METLNGSESAKIPRFRSVAYPSNTIAHCISLTESIYKYFGTAIYIPRDRICEKTGISDSHIQTQLSSCVQYGLLEMKPKEGYKPTPLFTKIYKPMPGENVNDAKVESFREPELYKNVIKEFNNQTHTIDGLATILFRKFKVSENASKTAAKIFLENAKELQLLNDENLFRIDGISDIQAVEQVEVLETAENRNANNTIEEIKFLPPQTGSSKTNKSFDHPPIPVYLDDGSVAEVYLPNGFKKDDINRIIKVLKAQIE